MALRSRERRLWPRSSACSRTFTCAETSSAKRSPPASRPWTMRKSGVRHEIARALLALGEAHAATLFDETIEGQHPAWDCFRRSITLLREVGDQAELAFALYQMGAPADRAGPYQPARNTLREALDIATRLRLGIAYEATADPG